MINGQSFFDQHMVTFEKLLLVKEIIALLVVYWIIITLITIK